MPQIVVDVTDNDSVVPFPDALIDLLAQRDLQQRDLAERVGVTRAAVNDWCRGRATPSPEMVFKIERALEIPPGELSKHLGFVPLTADPELLLPTSLKLDERIRQDPTLSNDAREMVLAVYRQAQRITRRSPRPR